MFVEKYYTPYIGKTGPLKKFYVSADDIRRFAEAARETDLCYFDEEYAKAQGYEGIIASPTFPISISLPMDPIPGVWDAPYGKIHGGQEFKFYKPMVADRWYYCQRKLADAFEKEGKKGLMVFMIEDYDFFDEDMQPVLTTSATVILRESLFELVGKEWSAEERKETKVEPVKFEDLSEGFVLPEIVADEVTRYGIAKYAGSAHDYNPIHFEDEAAQSIKFNGIIAHGMFSYAILNHAVNCWFGGQARFEPKGINTKFSNPCYLGTKPRILGRVTAVDPAERTVCFDYQMLDNNGAPMLIGNGCVKMK